MTDNSFSRRVIAWHKRSGRRDLPWQKRKTPYRVWVSEIMLQQTQVKTVIPYFLQFMRRFPSLKQLATAELDEVLRYWAGLGYYRRARHLHQAAMIIHQQYHGRFPKDLATLSRLPGIGRSTAGAILALCYEQPLPILDGNVKRVLTRYRNISGLPSSSPVNRKLWRLAERLLPANNISAYTQGLMDLGATLCTRNNPLCDVCPVRDDCRARIAGTIAERPQKARAKTKPTRSSVMLMITDTQSVLLQKRPAQGVWSGLLCFPELVAAEDAEHWCRKNLGVTGKIQKWDAVTHTFTHFTLSITPLLVTLHRVPTRVMEKDTYVWCKMSERLAVPAPIQRLIKQINEIE